MHIFFLLEWWHAIYTVQYLVKNKKSWRLLNSFRVPPDVHCTVLRAASALQQVRGYGRTTWSISWGSLPSDFQLRSANSGDGGSEGRLEGGRREKSGDWLYASLPMRSPPLATSVRLQGSAASRQPLFQVVLWAWRWVRTCWPNPRLQQSPLWVLLGLCMPLWHTPYK